MKHNIKITIFLILMFLITQFIGLYVVNYYSDTKIVDGKVQNVSAPELPYGLETPEPKQDIEFFQAFFSLIIAFIIAISVMFLLMKYRSDLVIRLWFFIVVVIALGISFNTLLSKFEYATIMILIIALPLAFFKVYKRNFLVHNFTELIIYPGIAAVFVPILNIYTIIILLLIISAYDIWAVWHSGVMQKMAKYQIDTLKVFSGFFVPYLSKKQKQSLKKEREKAKKKKTKPKPKKMNVNVAILGGGDVVFPIITSGIALKTFGLIPAIFVIIGATTGLSYLFLRSEKKKFYPAMPFITAGILIGMIIGLLVNSYFI